MKYKSIMFFITCNLSNIYLHKILLLYFSDGKMHKVSRFYVWSYFNTAKSDLILGL